METLTMERAVAEVQSLIAEFGPDYVYNPPEGTDQCRYVHDDAPGCIVGRLMHRLGASLDLLRTFEGRGSTSVTGALFQDVDPVADRYLSRLQGLQDAGRPWGEAEESARLYVSEFRAQPARR